MIERFDIAGYCRISVDEEMDRDNTSIENQKAIISDFVKEKFPGSSLTFFVDRDRSGYTFEQREKYQIMRKGLLNHKYDILIIKDFSRFSRRNSRGLVELEDLRDAGVRIISIGDNIDFPNDDEWLKIQFQFLINEMPVTDASRKVKAVVQRRQKDGNWICAAPYGYVVNPKKEFVVVPTEAEIVRKIYELYIEGWGYKRIANYLTDQGIPTPRASEQIRKEAEGKEYKRKVKQSWAIATIQGILENDFYIGTLRQSKYTRKKINGKDVKKDSSEHIVLENHHQPIISYHDFRLVQELMRSRTKACYRGVKKYENTYTGFLVCGDCGSPMFSMSRPDLRDAYRCGTYHRRGLKGCTSHYIRVETLDSVLKDYFRKLRETSAEMLESLKADIEKQEESLDAADTSAENLQQVLDDLEEELQVTRRQRMRDIRKHPEREDRLNDSYDALEEDLETRISNLQKQIELTVDRKNTILRVNRAAKTIMDVFDEALEKDHLDPKDLHLILKQIRVYEDHLDVILKPDIDSILRCGTFTDEPEEPSDETNCANMSEKSAENVDSGTNNGSDVTIIQATENRPDKVFSINSISDGDPLEIYTTRDGEVIFKKYSMIGGLEDFAARFCDTLSHSTAFTAAVTDRDCVIAVAGSGKRELLGKHLSPSLEQLMEQRSLYSYRGDGQSIPACEGIEKYTASVAAPILCQGDVLGLVLFLSNEDKVPGEAEQKLAQTVATFLGQQMED